MRLIDADALKEEIRREVRENSVGVFVAKRIFKLIDNATTVEPRIEYGTDGQPYRLFMSGGQFVPDVLQGWRYEERATVGEIIKAYTKGFDTGVETVRTKGEWVLSTEHQAWTCTHCGGYFGEIDNKEIYFYCPNCGAKMKEGAE